jgi:hypothetical protein
MKPSHTLKLSLSMSILIMLCACAKPENKKKSYPACSAQVVDDYQSVVMADKALEKMLNLSISLKSIALEAQEAKAVCEEVLSRHSDKNYPCLLTDDEVYRGIGRLIIPSYCESIDQNIDRFKAIEAEAAQQQNTIQLN